MDVYSDVGLGTIRIGLPPFRCPVKTKIGPGFCIAVKSEWGEFLVALYSPIVTLLFMVLWRLVSMGVMFLSHALDNEVRGPPGPPTPEKYRHILRGICLVGFLSRGPFQAVGFLQDYLRFLGTAPSGHPNVRRTAVWLLVLVAVWLSATSIAGAFVAAQLVAGPIAPANPNEVYVPMPAGTDSNEMISLQALRVPATLRSLAAAEFAIDQYDIGDLFLFDPHLSNGDSPQYFTYNYTVNALHMGLQKWPDLKQEVRGRCEVDSSWFSENIPDEGLDVYRPWGLANKTVNVAYEDERRAAPSATAFPFPYSQEDFLIHHAAEHRYGIIVHSSHRASRRPGTDPWYKTEPVQPQSNGKDVQTGGQSRNRVMGGRPALSCAQKDLWSYNGTQFKNIYELTHKANIKFPDGWVTQLRMDFSNPRIIDMINLAGSSSLVSSTTFIGGEFDAETSAIEQDMARMLAATWVASVQTFRNTLLVGNRQNISNAALDSGGKPQDGVDLFVVFTEQVTAIRVSVLISIPVLLGILLLAMRVLEFYARGKSWNKKMLFVDGTYLFARTQDPDTFQEPEILEKVVRRCVKRANSNHGPAAFPTEQKGGPPPTSQTQHRPPSMGP